MFAELLSQCQLQTVYFQKHFLLSMMLSHVNWISSLLFQFPQSMHFVLLKFRDVLFLSENISIIYKGIYILSLLFYEMNLTQPL